MLPLELDDEGSPWDVFSMFGAGYKHNLKGKMQEFTSGAKSTELKPRYDLIPIEALTYIAERLAYGASRHGEHNYKRGVSDPEFIRDRKNHAFAHLVHYLAGDTTAEDTPIDHLKAAITNLAMLAYLEENRDVNG